MKSLNFKGKNIQYQSLGNSSSPCLVLLHGYMENSTMWDKFHFLQQDYFLILIDLPGHGESDVIFKRHSMALQAHIVQQILNLEGIQKAKFFGHSMGGYIALAMAKYYPNYCNEIILFHSHPYADSKTKIAQRKSALNIVENNKDRYCNLMIPNLFLDQKTHAREIDKMIQEAKAMSKEGIMAAIEGMMRRPDYANFLQHLSINTSFILGAKDHLIPPLEEILNQFPNHPIHVLNQAGHMSHIEDWDSCKKTVEKILN